MFTERHFCFLSNFEYARVERNELHLLVESSQEMSWAALPWQQ